jgi:hypothetical protein
MGSTASQKHGKGEDALRRHGRAKGEDALRRRRRANTGATDVREGGGGKGEEKTSWRGQLEGVY